MFADLKCIIIVMDIIIWEAGEENVWKRGRIHINTEVSLLMGLEITEYLTLHCPWWQWHHDAAVLQQKKRKKMPLKRQKAEIYVLFTALGCQFHWIWQLRWNNVKRECTQSWFGGFLTHTHTQCKLSMPVCAIISMQNSSKLAKRLNCK